MKKIILLIISTLFVVNLSAADFTFDNLSEKDLENILREFSAGSILTTVSGASAGAKIFGIEMGLLVGAVEVPEIEKVVKAVNPNFDVAYVPHASLYAITSLPFGLNLEANYLPELEIDGLDIANTALGVRWAVSSVIELPVDVAVRVHYSKTSLSFTQSTPVAANVELKTDVLGAQVLVSKDMGVIEPYIGFGYVQTDGDLSATANIFNFTANNSASTKESSMHMTVGTAINLLLIKTGVEYSRVFDTNKVTAKLAFSF